MPQQEVQLDQEKFCCSMCLDLLKDPVSLPCGHNYCSKCIEEYWNEDDEQGRFSCPGCSQTFIPRPVLKKNTMLADMMDIVKNTGLQAVPPDHDGREDVVCDFCTRRKLKAVKTCLQCRVSYCDTHLQPHYQSPVFNNHRLVKASSKLPENVCDHHGEVKKLFCRTDQECICSLCSVEEHKGHDTISAAAEKTEKQKTFDTSQQNIQQRTHEREKDIKVLYQEVRSINHSADRAVDDSDTVFTNVITAIKRRRTEVRELIRDQQKHDVSRVDEQKKRVEKEVTELRRRHAELEQISQTEDPIHFLNSYTSLSRISESTGPVSSNVCPLRSFEDVAVSKVRTKLEDIFKEEVTNISESVNRVDVLLSPETQTRAEVLESIKLEDNFKIKEITKLFVVILLFIIMLTHPIGSSVQPQWTPGEPLGVQCLVQGHQKINPGLLGSWWWWSEPPEPKTRAEPAEPKTRAEFLQYSCPITLDPNTAYQYLSLSQGNRKVTMEKNKNQSYSHHRERFTEWPQVLSRQGLTGRCYWEVEWRGIVDIAVSYKDINRTGSMSVDSAYFNESGFGYSNKAWSLRCAPANADVDPKGIGPGFPNYIFNHIYSYDMIPGSVWSTRVGVYLDLVAGTLSFYSLSPQEWLYGFMASSYNMTLIHRVQTTFTQPLYAGFGFWFADISESAEFV